MEALCYVGCVVDKTLEIPLYCPQLSSFSCSALQQCRTTLNILDIEHSVLISDDSLPILLQAPVKHNQ